MAELFYRPWGLVLFYVCLVLYLYGDLAIYAVALPRTLTNVTCTRPTNWSSDSTKPWPCFGSIDSSQVYYLYLGLFALALGPFCFFNVQKTRYLQYITSFTRYSAFTLMILMAFIGIASGDGVPPATVLDRHDLSELPALFGVAIYSFMCHHSLPSLLTPLSDKRRLSLLLMCDVLLVFVFYAALCVSAVFRFGPLNLNPIYSLNFDYYSSPSPGMRFIAYYLGLFPVFTLSTNFPIVAITLRNNLGTLLMLVHRTWTGSRTVEPARWVRRIGLPLLALLPPVAIAFATQNVSVLVSITGSYAGLGIQYVIPATLVWLARRAIARTVPPHLGRNTHTSPFRHAGWLVLVAVWSVACVSLTTYHLATAGAV